VIHWENLDLSQASLSTSADLLSQTLFPKKMKNIKIPLSIFAEKEI